MNIQVAMPITNLRKIITIAAIVFIVVQVLVNLFIQLALNAQMQYCNVPNPGLINAANCIDALAAGRPTLWIMGIFCFSPIIFIVGSGFAFVGTVLLSTFAKRTSN